MHTRARGRRRDGLFVALLFLAALALRLSPFPEATARGWRLLSPDCYGHLRRTVSVARNFPRVPFHDPYLNHPDGGVFIWPPAFDLLAGAISRARYGAAATTGQVTRVAATLPAVLGALQVVPLFLLARRTFGRRRARIAAAAYVVIPAAVLWGGFGHFDQHVAEALNLLLVLATAAWAAAAPPGGRIARSSVFGAALALAVLTWQGAVFVAGLGLLWAAVALGEGAGAAALTAAVLVSGGAALTLPKEPVPFAFVSFGWFQPAVLALAAAPLLALSAWRAPSPRRRLVWGLAAAAAFAAALPGAERTLAAIFRGALYVFRERPRAGVDEFADGGFLSYPPDLHRLIAESRLLVAGWTSFERAVREVSPGWLLVPLAVFAWGRSAARNPWIPLRGRAAGRALVALVAAAVFVMALFQQRNVYYLSIFAALALAEGVARIAPRRLHGRARAFAPPALAAALVVLPGAPYLARAAAYAAAPGDDVLDLFARLKALDPPPVDPAALPPPAPGTIPGVMAPWSAGHFVTALAERPAAADPFLYGWRREFRLFTSTDDAEALAILRGARCRYLVTLDVTRLLPAYAAAAGRAPGPTSAMFVRRVHESSAGRPLPFLELVLDSRTGSLRPDGSFQPSYRVFRIDSP